MIGLVVIGAILLLSGGDEPESLAADADSAAEGGYPTLVRRPLDQLTRSAVATGTSLARVSEPGDINGFHRTVERQLEVVETARRSVARVSVAEPDRPAHRALITAAASQRRYLVALGRASSGQPSQSKVQAINRARKAGAQTLASYRGFFRLAPTAPDAITTTDLTDTAGLRSATQAAIAAAAAEAAAAADARRQADTARQREADPSYSRAVFSSVAGTDQGSTLVVRGDFCDRTPGAVNTMLFTLDMIDSSGVVVESTTQQTAETRMCSSVTFSLPDRYPGGSYTVRIRADNLTNNVSGTGQGSLFVS